MEKLCRPCLCLSILLLCAASVGADELVSRFADLDGVRVHYLDRGAGPSAVIFVPGWGCDLNVWREQMELDLELRSIFVDLPGHGESDKPQVEYSMDYLASAIEAVLSDAAVDRAILVGHSNGVPVVRQFYRRNPEQTRALIVAEGSFRPLAIDPERWQELVAPFRGDGYLDAVARMVPTNMDETLQQEVRSMMQATPQHVLVSTLEAVGDPAIWQEDEIEVPTLVLLAESPFWSADYEVFVRQLVPDVDYRMIEAASHFLQMESPEVFNEALLEFIDDLEEVGD